MAPFATIYSYPGNFRIDRAHFIASLGGLELANGDYTMGKTNTEPEFLSKFPLGKVPALETADGFNLVEGAAICSFLASAGSVADQLLGRADDIKTRARITEWSCFAEAELVAQVMPSLYMCVLKLAPFDEARWLFSVASLERALRRLELAVQQSSAAGSKFLVGDRITLADVMVGGALAYAAMIVFDAEMRKAVPGVAKYLEGLYEIPEWKKAFGELKLVEARIKP